MEEVNMLLEALKFMILGMGVVFLFLTVMIYVLKIQTFLVTKFFPIKEKEVIKKSTTVTKNEVREPAAVVGSTDAAKVAAIIAAIQHHKNLKG